MSDARTPPRTLSIGGATYDLFVQIDPAVVDHEGRKHLTIPVGTKASIRDVIETPGGGACNTSIGLARLGCDACFCGVIGDDQWGERMLENLHKEGVRTTCATVVEHEHSGFSIVLLLPNGERTILNHPGTNEHLDDVTFDLGAVKSADVVYLNRLSEGGCAIEDNIVEELTAVPDTHLTWNPGGCQLKAGMHDAMKKKLLACTDILLLNSEEAIGFTQKETIDEAMRALNDAGVKIVCVTDGADGAWASDGKNIHHCHAREDVHAIDTTGAGDAFGTAVTWAILRGEDLPTALKAGTLNAASVIGAIGAQAGLLTEDVIQKQLLDHPLSVSSHTL